MLSVEDGPRCYSLMVSQRGDPGFHMGVGGWGRGWNKHNRGSGKPFEPKFYSFKAVFLKLGSEYTVHLILYVCSISRSN
jgi:hypothetical protein